MGEPMSGRIVADSIKQRLAAAIKELAAENIFPKLAIVRVGQRGDDIAYEKGIIAAAESVGMVIELQTLPEDVPMGGLVELIHKLNGDAGIHGIMIFRPLPGHIDEKVIKSILSPLKDIDCFTQANEGKIFEGDASGLPPCTPAAVVEMLDYNGIELSGKDITIVGSSNVVGKPLALMLMNRKATVTVCNSRTRDLADKTKRADIVVVAAGRAKLINERHIRDGAVVLDVGINVLDGKMCGDVDYDSVIGKAGLLTPVPGGVGSVTTAVLLQNVVKACKLQLSV